MAMCWVVRACWDVMWWRLFGERGGLVCELFRGGLGCF
jgi:hypothetical protein